MRSLALVVATLAVALQLSGSAGAASLRVAPVLLDLRAPTAASTIRIWNDAARPMNVQIRVFRWTQRNGADAYEPTRDVVASPPMTTLRPGAENLVRIVRTSKQPLTGEESYRLIVDEVPDPSRRAAGTVVLVLRHSIPVFFTPSEPAGATASWTVARRKGGYLVTAHNKGPARLRLANLTLASRGATIARREGLVGYALGNSTVSWFVPGTGKAPSAGSLTISADSEAGRFDATARLAGG
jgi:fimbrial chaperone protein